MKNARSFTRCDAPPAEKTMRSQRHSRKKKVVTKKQSTGKDGPYHEMLLQFKKEESVGGVVFVFSAGGARRPASARSVQLIGGRDRPINPARRQERDGEDNAGQRRWAGALERSRLSGVRWQAARQEVHRCSPNQNQRSQAFQFSASSGY